MKKKTKVQERWSEIVHNDDFMPYKNEYGTKIQPIWGAHYMMYNILRGLPIDRGFDNKSDTFKKYLTDIWRVVKYGRDYSNIIQIFEPAVSFEDAKEKADEAVRIYSSS